MPVYLDETNIDPEIAGLESVLIVPCRFCPAASMAVKNKKPYIELFRRFLRTGPYERFIKDMKQRLESRGLKTSVFKSRLLHQFVLCMWTSARRKELLKRAREHEAVVVLGCEAAGHTVRQALRSTQCKVIQGMKSKGIMSVKPRLHFPCNLSLELEGVTQLTQPTQ